MSKRAVFLAFVVAVSVVAGAAPVSQPAGAVPPGFVNVPVEDKISDDIEDELPWDHAFVKQRAKAGTLASDHASTTVVRLKAYNKASGKFLKPNLPAQAIANAPPLALALEIEDDVAHEGREVAIDAAVLVEVLGERPELAFGKHEDGTDWTAAVEYEDGYAVFEVPRFSTNTITWSGQFTFEGEPATDGTTFTYDQNAAVANYTINVTGHTATEWDNQTDMGVGASKSTTSANNEFAKGSVSGAAEVDGSQILMEPVEETTTTFSYTGSEQTFSVPDRIYEVDVVLDGAGTGPAGGRVTGALSTTPGETLYVYVGGDSDGGQAGAWPNGGAGGNADSSSSDDHGVGGAGGTSIRQGGNTLSDRVAVAGGAGGKGRNWHATGGEGAGGEGGADTGDAGDDATRLSASATGGSGGTQSAGGSAGSPDVPNDRANDGSLGQGGDGGSDWASDEWASGGGGGGGYYGGGGGGAEVIENDGTAGAGGGGGSNYVDGLASVSANERGNGSTGDGSVDITYSNATATYISANHSVPESTKGYVDITTLDNATVTVTFEEWDGSSWSTLNQTTGITTVANHSFTWSEATHDTIRVNVTSSATSGDTTVNISKDMVVGGATPAVNAAGNLQPTGEGATGNATLKVTGKADDTGATPRDVTVTASDGDSVTFSTLGTNTATKELNVTTSTTDLSFTFVEGKVDYWLNYTERTQTVDPTVEVNGNTVSHAGTLADGTTDSLTTNTNWVNANGENQVNITVGDGSLSADAPTPSVDLYYTHDGEDKSEVSYDGEKWQETYNVSKTFARDQSDATVDIPFQGSVVRVRTLEKRVNGGSWSTIAEADYTLSGTDLTAHLGSVSSNDKVEVRTNGSKVNPSNCAITVQEPTTLGDDLDSKIKLDSKSDGCNIGVGGTEDGTEIHYTTGESWSAPDEFARFEAGGVQKLYLPNAAASDTFRVTTLPVSVSPQAGDVDVSIDAVDTSEPSFAVEEGPSPTDPVDYTFENAVGGTDYLLYSTTEDTVRASGTASSPLTLSDDDSVETLQFQVDSGAAGGGTGGGGGGGGGTTVVTETVQGIPIWVFALAFGLIVLAYVGFGRRQPDEPSGLRGRASAALGDFARFVFTNRIAQVGLGVLGLIALVQTGVLPRDFVQVLGFLVVPPVVWWILRRTDNWDRQGQFILAGVTLVALVFAAETLAPGALLGPTGEAFGGLIDTVGPLLAIAAVYLVWRWTRDDKQTVPEGTVLVPARVQNQEDDNR